MLNLFKIYKFSLYFSIIVLLLLYEGVGMAQQNPQVLFQAGLYTEEVQGDLDKAISLFQQIIDEYPDHRPIAANALLHIGFCYEKLGEEKARDAYQKIITESPDQREIAEIARDRLKESASRVPKSEIKIDPLVKYYFDRIGIDPLTSTLRDGNYLALTDWTTGNLVVKNLATEDGRRLTDSEWPRSAEFAYNPVWSRDGKKIAFSWYRGPFFVELRILSLADNKSRVVYSNPELVIFPQDWTPDGENILCRVIDITQDEWGYLYLISAKSGNLTKLTRLGAHSRGMKFSPNGKFITYDLPDDNLNFDINRHIYIFSLDSHQQTQVTGTYSETSDTPIWSPDGKLILYRSLRLWRYDLWALPISNGKPAGNPYLLQSEMNKVLLSLKKIKNHSSSKLNQQTLNNSVVKKSEISFEEEFTSPVLDPAWSIYEWKGPNVYGYNSFGRYSLTDNPGHLRYYLDPIIFWSYQQSYQPSFSRHWYWWYPGLEISRPISGNRWILETKVTYSIVDGVNGRYFALVIFFEPGRNKETALMIVRGKDFHKKDHIYFSSLMIRLFDQGSVVSENKNCLASEDTIGVTKFTYHYRISRANTLITVELSEDGENYKKVLSGKLKPDLLDIPQQLAITGNSWYVPAGSYADWDYIRFKILD